MLLITIGENLKNLDKVTHGQLLSEYPEIEWEKRSLTPMNGISALHIIIFCLEAKRAFLTSICDTVTEK